jgi:hypothetical protein
MKGAGLTTPHNKIAIPGGFFSEELHAYTDAGGMRVPSVTQVFGILGFTDYDTISKEVLARKSAIGVAVHTAVQYLCEGCLDWDTVAEEAMPYVVAGEMWMRDQGFVSIAQEGQGIHSVNGMSYGYMFDHIGTMMYKGRHRHVILDLKTTVATSPTWKLQTAAYSLAAPKLPAGERYLRCILQLKANGKSTPHYFENRQDEMSWQYALYTAIWGINEGLYSLEKAA